MEPGVHLTRQPSIIVCFLTVMKYLPFSGGDRPEEVTGGWSFYDVIFLISL